MGNRPSSLGIFGESVSGPVRDQEPGDFGTEIGRLRTQGAILFHIRDGKVTRLVFYWESERARTDHWRESYEGWARDS
jgi:hypothetical protein